MISKSQAIMLSAGVMIATAYPAFASCNRTEVGRYRDQAVEAYNLTIHALQAISSLHRDTIADMALECAAEIRKADASIAEDVQFGFCNAFVYNPAISSCQNAEHFAQKFSG